MKRALSIILIMVIPTFIFAQNYRLSLQAGYGTYSLGNMRAALGDAWNYHAGLGIKKVDDFPGFLNYSATAEMYLSSMHLLGINYAYYFTGGHNYKRDYSGEYSLKIPVNASRIGIQYKFIFLSKDRLKYFAQARGGFVFSNMKTIEHIAINNVDSVSNTKKDTSSTLFLEPSLGLSYNLGNGFSLDSSIGWQFDITSEFLTKKYSYMYWTGLRLLVGIAYEF